MPMVPCVTPGSPLVAATTSATAAQASSAATPAPSSRPRSRPSLPISAPPPYAPTRKPASANREADSEKPGAPTRANAAKTTLPVMFATKTRPRARIETASTTPVTTVSTSSSPRSGPSAGSATSDLESPVWSPTPLRVPAVPLFATFLPRRARVVYTQRGAARARGKVCARGSVRGPRAGPGLLANDLIVGFVGGHKPGTWPEGGGYKRLREPADLLYYFLRPHRAGESIQDKSEDDRLYFCHQPAYD